MFSKLFLCLNRNYEFLRMIKFNFTERDIVFDFCTNVLCVSQLSRTPLLLKVDEHKLLSILINALYDNANMSYWFSQLCQFCKFHFSDYSVPRCLCTALCSPFFFQLFAIHILSCKFVFVLVNYSG